MTWSSTTESYLYVELEYVVEDYVEQISYIESNPSTTWTSNLGLGVNSWSTPSTNPSTTWTPNLG